jgi:hypothetical protein
MRMRIKERVEVLRTLVRNHGNYRLVAEKSSVGYEWLSKFATGSIPNPTISNVAKLEVFFENNKDS